jgi:di/tricarboxylate transporter
MTADREYRLGVWDRAKKLRNATLLGLAITFAMNAGRNSAPALLMLLAGVAIANFMWYLLCTYRCALALSPGDGRTAFTCVACQLIPLLGLIISASMIYKSWKMVRNLLPADGQEPD